VRVEYANPIPRDEDERGEVVKGSGDTEGEEGGPADEVVMDAFLGEEEMEGAGAADEAQQPADATEHVDSARQPRSDCVLCFLDHSRVFFGSTRFCCTRRAAESMHLFKHE
jgi:hypothetical protein